MMIRTKKMKKKTQMIQRICKMMHSKKLVHIQHRKCIQMVCQSHPVRQKRCNLKMVMSYRSNMVRAFSKNKIVYETLLQLQLSKQLQMRVGKSLFLSVDLILDKVNAGINFTHHCIFSNPALFRNYFVINLHFQIKLNQNALH